MQIATIILSYIPADPLRIPRPARRLGEFDSRVEGPAGDTSCDESDCFGLLTEYAMRGLKMLGSPKPHELAAALQAGDQSQQEGEEASAQSRSERRPPTTLLGLLMCCFTGSREEAAGGSSSSGALAPPTSQRPGFEALSEQDVEEVRSLLLVLVIAAGKVDAPPSGHSSQHGPHEPLPW